MRKARFSLMAQLDRRDEGRDALEPGPGAATRTTTTATSEDDDDDDEDVTASAMEKRILKQLRLQQMSLKLQYGLLMEMQRKLDMLSDKVDHYLPPQQNGQQQQHRQVYTPPPLPQRLRAAAAAAGVPRRPVHQQQQPRRYFVLVVLEMLLNPHQFVRTLLQTMYQSRIARIIRLFVRMQREQVQEQWDAAFIFKILVITAILLARWSSHYHNSNDTYSKMNRRKKAVAAAAAASDTTTTTFLIKQFWESYRFYIMFLAFFMGILVHSGYLQFLYNFFIKENYPVRIWCGENVDDEDNNNHRAALLQRNQNRARQPLPPMNRNGGPAQQQQPPAAAARGGRGGIQGRRDGPAAVPAPQRWLDWNTILEQLRGFLVVPPQQQQDNNNNNNNNVVVQMGQLVLKTVLDFICLLGSFVLSIFPMINLEDLRRQQEPQDGDDNNNNHDHRNNGGRGEADGEGPGHVDPPRDPVEALDE